MVVGYSKKWMRIFKEMDKDIQGDGRGYTRRWMRIYKEMDEDIRGDG